MKILYRNSMNNLTHKSQYFSNTCIDILQTHKHIKSWNTTNTSADQFWSKTLFCFKQRYTCLHKKSLDFKDSQLSIRRIEALLSQEESWYELRFFEGASAQPCSLHYIKAPPSHHHLGHRILCLFEYALYAAVSSADTIWLSVTKMLLYSSSKQYSVVLLRNTGKISRVNWLK